MQTINVITHRNGYELQTDKGKWFYFTVERLLLGAAWHIRDEVPVDTDVDEILEAILKHNRFTEVMRKKIRETKSNYEVIKRRSERRRKHISYCEKLLSKYGIEFEKYKEDNGI